MKKKTLIVSHDAGGANILAHYVRKHAEEQEFECLVDGPAQAIFRRVCPNIRFHPASLPHAKLAETKWERVLTGSSWASALERTYTKWARENGFPTAVYLDHWTYRKLKESMSKEDAFPDEFWVGDPYALECAKAHFEGKPIKQKTNPYLEETITAIQTKARPVEAPIKILYVTEPTSQVAQKLYQDPNKFGYTEFEALEGMLAMSEESAHLIDRVRIRPHPSESPEKYKAIAETQKKFPIEFSQNPDLIPDCQWADWIVGCNSMVMAIAALAEKRVYCTIPEGKGELSLPMTNIYAYTPRVFLPYS